MSKQFYVLPNILAAALREKGLLVTRVNDGDVSFTISEQMYGTVVARSVVILRFYSDSNGDDVWLKSYHTNGMDETIELCAKLNNEFKNQTSPPTGFRKEV